MNDLDENRRRHPGTPRVPVLPLEDKLLSDSTRVSGLCEVALILLVSSPLRPQSSPCTEETECLRDLVIPGPQTLDS